MIKILVLIIANSTGPIKYVSSGYPLNSEQCDSEHLKGKSWQTTTGSFLYTGFKSVHSRLRMCTSLVTLGPHVTF